jgi:beta-galactosidase
MNFHAKPVWFLRSCLAAAWILSCAAKLPAAESPRDHLSLDLDWKFHLGDDWPNASDLSHLGTSSGPITERFNDSSWLTVSLPHDWAIELPFDRSADKDHGYRPIGPNFPRNSVGWYRRTFSLSGSDAGKRIWLTFDGVYRGTEVWVNGWLVSHHEGGYNPFREDITDVVRFGGRNTIAVRVDASKFEGWFYEGAGIYRHVWLDTTSPLAVAPEGVFVYATFPNGAPDKRADLHVEATLLNRMTNAASAAVNCDIISPDGSTVAVFKGSDKVAGEAQQVIKLESRISSPALWSPESPRLYKLITSVSVGGKLVDRQETPFGVRSLAFDATNGFILNGQHYEIKGVCIHQDWAGVGIAVPDSLQYFRVSRLKEMGCNAIRTAHNPPAPGFLDACDRLGILVMDEHRLPGSDSESLRKWEGQIRRDRNHPAVAFWSLGNEERGVEDTAQGATVFRSMQDLVKRLDPTRPVTYAAPEGNVFRGANSIIEVRGWNYYLNQDTDRYHAEHHAQPEICTEQGSFVSTRGIYANDRAHGYISSYDTNWPGWTPPNLEALWSFVAARPWLSGMFVWAGFDYGGEPSPLGWPDINSHFGILDRCGFPKDAFYYYQSWWTTKTVLHLLPHWNWPGKRGQPVLVEVYSNCKQVELFLNGDSLGRQEMKTNSVLRWQVNYQPGALSAKGFDAAGNPIAETKMETTGDATQIQLTPDRKAINADGEDVAVYSVAALDGQGHFVPLANNQISFTVEGPGKIIGVGNGDPACHEPDKFPAGVGWSRSLFNGLAQVIVQSTRDAGEIKLRASADGLAPATAIFDTQPCPPRPSLP